MPACQNIKKQKVQYLMLIGLLGTKIGMTQIFDSKSCTIPVTVLRLGPCVITQLKNLSSDGYNAIQLGYSEVRTQLLTKAELGHLSKAKSPPLKYLREFKVKSLENFEIGQIVTVNQLKTGELIDISAKSIGKGFTGCQKKHNFSIGPMSHGCKNHRQPGSIGAGTTPGRVFPGKKMAGRYGGKKVTIRNLQIIDINQDKHIVIVKGSIPGKPGSILSIKAA